MITKKTRKFGSNTVVVSIRISERLNNKLLKMSEKLGRSRSDLIAELLYEAVYGDKEK